MCRCASVFNPAMFCETVRMFMVAMVHGPFGFRFGFSALFRNSEFENSGSATGRTMDIERVETFAGRASPRGLVILASAVEQRRTGLGPYSGPTRAQFRGPALPTPTRLCGCVRSEK